MRRAALVREVVKDVIFAFVLVLLLPVLLVLFCVGIFVLAGQRVSWSVARKFRAQSPSLPPWRIPWRAHPVSHTSQDSAESYRGARRCSAGSVALPTTDTS